MLAMLHSDRYQFYSSILSTLVTCHQRLHHCKLYYSVLAYQVCIGYTRCISILCFINTFPSVSNLHRDRLRLFWVQSMFCNSLKVTAFLRHRLHALISMWYKYLSTSTVSGLSQWEWTVYIICYWITPSLEHCVHLYTDLYTVKVSCHSSLQYISRHTINQ